MKNNELKNHELVAKFQEVCVNYYEGHRVGHAYANGYLGSIVGQLLELASENDRQKFRRYLETSIEEMSRSSVTEAA